VDTALEHSLPSRHWFNRHPARLPLRLDTPAINLPSVVQPFMRPTLDGIIQRRIDDMVKTLFKIIVVLVIGLLTYNFFFGSREEKETSRQVVGQVRDLSSSVIDLLRSEKQKLSEGKYDEALAKLKQAIGIEKAQADALGHEGEECLGQCEHLYEQELALEEQLETIEFSTTMTEAEQAAALEEIRVQILQLTKEAEAIANELRQ
jgi:hypothetical protein